SDQENFFYHDEIKWNNLKRIPLNRENVFCSEINNNIKEKLVFAYQLFEKCKLECNYHGVVNIVSGPPHYLLCGSLNKKPFDKGEILCFYFDPNKELIYDILDESNKRA
ncbi:10883_t:CDS:2, partial [Scutellospora calospora]